MINGRKIIDNTHFRNQIKSIDCIATFYYASAIAICFCCIMLLVHIQCYQLLSWLHSNISLYSCFSKLMIAISLVASFYSQSVFAVGFIFIIVLTLVAILITHLILHDLFLVLGYIP